MTFLFSFYKSFIYKSSFVATLSELSSYQCTLVAFFLFILYDAVCVVLCGFSNVSVLSKSYSSMTCLMIAFSIIGQTEVARTFLERQARQIYHCRFYFSYCSSTSELALSILLCNWHLSHPHLLNESESKFRFESPKWFHVLATAPDLSDLMCSTMVTVFIDRIYGEPKESGPEASMLTFSWPEEAYLAQPTAWVPPVLHFTHKQFAGHHTSARRDDDLVDGISGRVVIGSKYEQHESPDEADGVKWSDITWWSVVDFFHPQFLLLSFKS